MENGQCLEQSPVELIMAFGSQNALYVCTHNCTCAGSMPLSKGSFERRHSNDPTPLQPPVQFSVSLALFSGLGGAPLSWQGFSFLRWRSFFLGALVLVLGRTTLFFLFVIAPTVVTAA